MIPDAALDWWGEQAMMKYWEVRYEVGQGGIIECMQANREAIQARAGLRH